jgi:plastocyanin
MMRRILLSVFLIVVARSPAAFAQAVIEGTVRLPKPTAAALNPPHYPNQATQPGPADLPTAVVYLDGATGAAAHARPAQMAQRNAQFAPGLLPIQRGTTVEFPNQDDFYHNVFSYSKTKRFDLGRYRKDEKPATQVFNEAGVVRLSCEIHSHMQGVILVLDTPYFQKTDSAGHYRLEGLPAGKYVLKVWISEREVYDQPVELTPDSRIRIDFPGR